MAAKGRRFVVNVSLHDDEWDYDETVSFLGKTFRLVRQGTGGDVEAAENLIWRWSLEADAIAVTGIREIQAAGEYDGDPAAISALLDTTDRVPVTDGDMITDVLAEWAIRHVQNVMPGYFNNARVVVLGGSNHGRTVKVLREFTENLEFADPWMRVDVPAVLEANPVLAKAAELGLFTKLVPEGIKHRAEVSGRALSHAVARRAARNCDVVVCTYDELAGFGLEDLAGKTLVMNAVSPERLADLGARGVDLVIDPTPQPFPFTIVPATLEAMALAANKRKRNPRRGDLLRMIDDAGLKPRLLRPNGDRRKSRFAFVIHPLSQQHFKNVQPLSALTQVPGMTNLIEKAVAYAPPFVYSHVTGIQSPTGAEAEGWLLSVGGTPRELLAHTPEFTYSRLLEAAEMARKLGAQVMGLGAFTKVVGDAGVTVAKQASLPITTGNSYSASGALWAAHDAVRKLGIAEIDADGRIKGKAMVVGATGAIGSVCARLLALACDELWLVSPETAKLLAIKNDIQREHPRAVLHVADHPDEAIADMDLIVTATSAAGQKVLDVMKIKPGCVITDVARPLDLSAEDVAKRPDILVIESGEIELPGDDVRMRNIGLPKGVAYACLAETVVLALEGRYETFTVGRNIEWEKVKEIYELGLKHGMKLATISGVRGVFTDKDFARVRELALAARAATAAEGASTTEEATPTAKARVDGPTGRCPRCGAGVGEPCRTPSGRPTATHRGRPHD